MLTHRCDVSPLTCRAEFSSRRSRSRNGGASGTTQMQRRKNQIGAAIWERNKEGHKSAIEKSVKLMKQREVWGTADFKPVSLCCTSQKKSCWTFPCRRFLSLTFQIVTVPQARLTQCFLIAVGFYFEILSRHYCRAAEACQCFVRHVKVDL